MGYRKLKPEHMQAISSYLAVDAHVVLGGCYVGLNANYCKSLQVALGGRALWANKVQTLIDIDDNKNVTLTESNCGMVTHPSNQFINKF